MKFLKPKFWDKEKPSFIAYLLYPFTVFIKINNLIKRKKIKFNKVKTICVGNIYVGGTGKTPLTIEISKELKKENIKSFVIKKYYKDQEDENNIYLNNKIDLISEKNRLDSLYKSLELGANVALFDDGLQDKILDYDLKIVCFSTDNWIGNGMLIPSGPLREKISSINKYDLIFLNGESQKKIEKKNIIKKINSNIPIFETEYKITDIEKFDKSFKYLIFSGIGNPKNFEKVMLKNNFEIENHFVFPDHYDYTKKDLNKITHYALEKNLKIITTEKDYYRIDSDKREKINFIKVNLAIKNKDLFLKLIKSKI